MRTYRRWSPAHRNSREIRRSACRVRPLPGPEIGGHKYRQFADTTLGEVISDRLAFGVASVFGSALVGAMMQYLLTGKGPTGINDLAYPKTGKINRDGTEERLSFP